MMDEKANSLLGPQTSKATAVNFDRVPSLGGTKYFWVSARTKHHNLLIISQPAKIFLLIIVFYALTKHYRRPQRRRFFLPCSSRSSFLPLTHLRPLQQSTLSGVPGFT